MSAVLALAWREWRLVLPKAAVLLAFAALATPAAVGIAFMGGNPGPAAMLAAVLVGIPFAALVLGSEASTPDGAAPLLHALPASPALIGLVRLGVRAATLLAVALVTLVVAHLMGGTFAVDMPIGRAGGLNAGMVVAPLALLAFACAALASALTRRAMQALVAGTALLAALLLLATLLLASLHALYPWARSEWILGAFAMTGVTVVGIAALLSCLNRRSAEPVRLRGVLRVVALAASVLILLVTLFATGGDALARLHVAQVERELSPFLAEAGRPATPKPVLATAGDVLRASSFIGDGRVEVFRTGDAELHLPRSLRDVLTARTGKPWGSTRQLDEEELAAFDLWLVDHVEAIAKARLILEHSKSQARYVGGIPVFERARELHSVLLRDALRHARGGALLPADNDLRAARMLSDTLLHGNSWFHVRQGARMSAIEARMLRELPHIDREWDTHLAQDLAPLINAQDKARLRKRLEQIGSRHFDIDKLVDRGDWQQRRRDPVLLHSFLAWLARPLIRWQGAESARDFASLLREREAGGACAPRPSRGMDGWSSVVQATRERELTRLVMAVRAQRGLTRAWPAELPGVAGSACDPKLWSWIVSSEGVASISFMGPALETRPPEPPLTWSESAPPRL